MNVFDVHQKIIADYDRYIRSFVTIDDPQIEAKVNQELGGGKLWPEPLLQFNPAFRFAGAVADLAKSGVVHKDVADVFKGYSLYQHQLDAIRLGAAGKDFVVTSGTGSGKSLAYIGTIFSHLLSNPTTKGVVAIVVYPLNALINSQTEEFSKYRENFETSSGREFPITFGQYTGQEKEEKREHMRAEPPQTLLTNYMMLELLLTRTQERSIRDAIYENLRYLVFDELHTYRGRQGADVAMLIRRIARNASSLFCASEHRQRWFPAARSRTNGRKSPKSPPVSLASRSRRRKSSTRRSTGPLILPAACRRARCLQRPSVRRFAPVIQRRHYVPIRWPCG